MAKAASIVGDLINFRGLVYAPLNEDGVVFLFGRVVDDLHMYIEEIKPGFPDCIARRFTGKGWERVAIEFEFKSSNFRTHGHNPEDCDIIVCWEHDWKACPIEVIELKSELQDMENWPIKQPSSSTERQTNGQQALEELFVSQRVPTQVQEWYRQIEASLHDWNEEIWTNIGNERIGFYAPEKSFASIRPKPNSLRIYYFSRGEPLPKTRMVNAKRAPRWGVFTVKQSEQVGFAVETLRESWARLKDAIKSGEPTSYFSGGMKPSSGLLEDLELDEEMDNQN